MMTISEEQREFFTQKNPAEVYDTITFNHSEFKEPVRLVLNQHKPLVFAGNEFIPVAAKLDLPSQSDESAPRVTVQFSRAHVGDEFKKIINSISAFGWQEPITMLCEQYTELSMSVPVHKFKLYVTEDGIKFNRTGVEVTASDDNSMTLGLGNANGKPIYTTEEYRGLEDA